MGRGKVRKPLPNGYIDHVLDLKPFLPPFAFELEICKTRGGRDDAPTGLLGRRLERLQNYESRMRTVAKVLTARKGEDNAAGSPGHTSTCDCKCSDMECIPIDPCCGEIRTYITELLTLKDKTWCYKPSDIAYIENVAPYETRIRTHGSTRTVVESSEDETTSSREEMLDHQVTDRFNLQQEMTKNLKASLDVDAKLHYGKTGGAYSFDLNTHGSLSQETSYREAREQVREQVEHATLKMQVQTRKLRTRTVTTQQTETNKHKFKNTTAIAAVSKYFWVTQEKQGQLFSHGPRLHIDLLVPSPAMLFLKMEEIKRKAGEPKKPTAPIYPNVGGKDLIPKLITPGNYEDVCIENGIYEYGTPPAQPADYDGGLVTFEAGASDAQVDVPAGYHITKMWVSTRDFNIPFGVIVPSHIEFQFGGQSVKVFQASVPLSDEATIDVSTSGTGFVTNHGCGAHWTGTVTFRYSAWPVDLGPWQKSLFKPIMEKYANDLEKYEAKGCGRGFRDFEIHRVFQ